MDSFELSKVAGAVLAALLLIFGTRVLIESILEAHGPEVVGYELPTEVAAAPSAGSESAPAPDSGSAFDPAAVVALLATAKPEDGKEIFRKCTTCHIGEKDKPSGIAPNLWGIVGRPKGSQSDFANYSEAMKSKGGEWTYTDLASFIHKPKGFVAGTRMIFAGLSDNGDLANLIAYLRTLSDQPAPLPN